MFQICLLLITPAEAENHQIRKKGPTAQQPDRTFFLHV